MTQNTESLIQLLAQNLRPVKRLRPPGLRAALWLGAVASVACGIILGFSHLGVFMRRASDPKLALELAATLLTGILATVSAFELSLPDRPLKWAFLPAPSLLLWIGASSYSCWRQWVAHGADGWQLDESSHCFLWIVAFGLPLGGSLFIVLRKSHPLAPGPVAAMAGLSVASLAAFLLQFFHPFDVTFIDLGTHIAAVATVVILARAAARPGLNAG